MTVYDSIIVGGGASGLFASRTLALAGKRVIVLEAADRLGGRICTINNSNFSTHIEAGAEFVHGQMPITLSLFEQLGIQLDEMTGEMYEVEAGQVNKSSMFNDDWEKIIRKLNELTEDVVFDDFLAKHFPHDEDLKKDIVKFVEGYNAADSSKVSSFSLRDEWSQEEEPQQNRPVTGYGAIIDFLGRDLENLGVEIKLGSEVITIDWSYDNVNVTCQNGKRVHAKNVLITVPLGVLQTESIKFNPSLAEITDAAKNVGFGPVLKFIVEFRKRFWDEVILARFPNVMFIFSDAEIPTWWSQLPRHLPILTGWLAGPNVSKAGIDSNHIELAAKSMAYILGADIQEVRRNITAFHVADWHHNDFIKGAYSYETIKSAEAKKKLRTPIGDKIYFAGEGIYSGPFTGTVEAALQSGRDTAEYILSSFKKI